MDKYTVFDQWAPGESPWSAWAKPTPFANLPEDFWLAPCIVEHRELGQACIPAAAARIGLIVDIPGVEAVAAALTLAAMGYRPVPLFNACPAPLRLLKDGYSPATVDVGAIVRCLVSGADTLSEMKISVSAPPVFLLDVNRSRAQTIGWPGVFDNRSVVFASDFPSAEFILKQGIERILLVHAQEWPIGMDLVHALGPWIASGLMIDVITDRGEPLRVRWPRGVWGQRLVKLSAWLRFRRNPEGGGFGDFVPETSAG